MALDELRDTDQVFNIDNFQYLVNKDFLEKAKPIKVDFLNIGFKITSGIELGSGCGDSCKSSCGC
jgi:iron-sulfur cluster assembly protein